MEFLSPSTLEEALEAKSAHPDAVPIMGGTDVMVELNFDKRRPPALIDLARIPELAEYGPDGDRTRLGAGVPYTTVIEHLSGRAPALAKASRSVASPQIRNRGTVGGNLAGASPAGDAHPSLLATDATVELASVRGRRRVPVREFFLSLRKTARSDDELITAVLLPEPSGPQQFAKIGTRNAMVIAVTSFALALDGERRAVGTGLGSAGPTPLRAEAAEEFLAQEFDWEGGRSPSEATVRRFGELVAAAARPIDDQRGSAEYRRHALAVMARRALSWSVTDYRKGVTRCA
ncbi:MULTISPECIES: FAD binding domain-containing protein [Nocardiopsis]|uniref:CO/xanthine dehydrogenase FAD-binding subunit n=1 Tax=Nocardiopsis sinuspersici TaxID=501010 RepID=A0A1V3C095_9ACTN|nr:MULTISPECIES: FAD binding domain-containing protein [Nocardiopsis]NYH55064.1 CO/xanthine dehydrogenase FAD-binding subunit [Nocardiopsis sinuspersici]OOC53780.1 carbon monoxide dehydrogenase [Nocardiopsis sinuspersici]